MIAAFVLHREEVYGCCSQLSKAATARFNKSRAQSRQQLLMNIVEAAVTENYDDIFWLKQRNNSLRNGIGILFVERRPAGPGNRSHNSLRF